MDPLKTLAECKQAYERYERTADEARAYQEQRLINRIQRREDAACKVLDRAMNKTTKFGKDYAFFLLNLAFKRGEISERVFDQYWVRLNGLEVAA